MKTVTVELLTIGDELLYGQITDTNSQWMSAELDKLGFRVIRKTTVGDREDHILSAFAEAESRADIVLITGGLGPTSDDLTKPCLAKFFDCEIETNEQALAELTEFFRSRGRTLTGLNRQQAALPVCCTMISNKVGTAPGMWFDRNNKVFVSMPGVPAEMKKMMSEEILPRLQSKFASDAIVHYIIRTAGIGESFLAEKISAWEKSLPPHIKLAYLPSLGEVKLRLTASGKDKDSLQKEVEALAGDLRPLAGQYIYGYGDQTLELALGNILREKKLGIAAAESCTGGYIAHLLTMHPGSSGHFRGGLVAYSNDVKANVLNVSRESLEQFGAVSEQVIVQMAENIRTLCGADIGVATSGIAGPDGGTPEKPVGTVWIAFSDGKRTVSKKLQLTKERSFNIRHSAVAALNLVLAYLQNREV